jgi:predicted outer membrane repeat protein
MSNIIVKVFITSLLIQLSLTASSITVEGDINTSTWNADTVFVTGNLTINNHEILTIMPGTDIIFEGDYHITVGGRIYAIGEEDNIIQFYPSMGVNWGGIRLQRYPLDLADTSNFVYCNVQGISNNSYYGAISVNNYEFVNIEHCVFHENNSTSSGGAISIEYSKANISSSNFYNNEAWNGGAISCGRGASVTIINNVLKSNYAGGSGGAISIWDADLVVITKNFISGNITESGAGHRGGGGIQVSDSECYVLNNIITNNKVNNGDGGGISLSGGKIVQNNLIVNNNANFGGGIYDSGTNVRYSNNTIVYNSAEKGGGIYVTSDHFYNSSVANSIFYFNTSSEGEQVYLYWGNNTNFHYNNIQGGKESFGSTISNLILKDYQYLENIDYDPSFKNMNSNEILKFEDAKEFWSLNSNSLSINAGKNNNFYSEGDSLDLSGNPRVYDEIIDQGAFEFQSNPDLISVINVNIKNLDFGITDINSMSNIKYLTLKNDGHSDLLISSILLPDGFLTPNSSGGYSNEISNILVNPKSDTLLQVIFSPTERQIYEDSIIIISNSDTNSELFISLKGEGRKITNISGFVSSDLTIEDFVFVDDDLTVGDDVTLTIVPGSILNISAGKRIEIKGRILALGTELDSIVFTSADTSGFYSNPNEIDGGWKGIFFNNSDGLLNSSDTSKFNFCKIEYCKTNSDEITVHSGAVRIIEYSKVSINNSLFQRNMFRQYNSYGGAIYINNCSPKISNNLFQFNTAIKTAGAIYCVGSSCSPLISGNTFRFNNSRNGGAINSSFESSPFIISNVFDENISQENGGAIYCEDKSRAIIRDNKILRNKASTGGGLYFMSGKCILQNNYIINNYASYKGGGMYLNVYNNETESLTIIGNIFANNTALSSGGGLAFGTNRVLTINNTIVNNYADRFGAIDGLTNMYNNIIWGNESKYGPVVNIDTTNIYKNTLFQLESNSEIENFRNDNFVNNIINVDPMFQNPTVGSGLDYDAFIADWNLKDSSLAIDGGILDTDSITVDSLDIYGNVRVFNDKIDIGAIEMQFIPAKFAYLYFAQDSINFHGTTIGHSSGVLDLVLNNFGSEDAQINNLNFPDGFWGKFEDDEKFDTSLAAYTLKAKSDTVFNLTLRPFDVRNYGGHIQITSENNANSISKSYVFGFGSSSKFVEGVIEGDSTWSDSIRVTGNIIIDDEATLTISSGTHVLFEGPYSIEVKGSIKCLGMENDSVSFTLLNNSKYDKWDFETGWAGINIPINTSEIDSSYFLYTIFSYAITEHSSCLNLGRTGVLIDHCKFHDNFSLYRAGALSISDINIVISNSIFENNESYRNAGAVQVSALSSYIKNCSFLTNIANGRGGALSINGNSEVTNCLFSKNRSEDHAAISIFASDARMLLKNNIIANNYAKRTGGAIGLLWNDMVLINNVIVNNTSGYNGGGIYMDINSSDIENPAGIVFLNNTISNNNTAKDGGGIYIKRSKSQGMVNFYNNIITGNVANDTLSQIYFTDPFPYHFYNCNLEGYQDMVFDSLKFTGTIDVEPNFVNPTDRVGYLISTREANWRLLDDSECINVGTAEILNLDLPLYDIEGKDRIVGKIDIGAFENQTVVSINDDNNSIPKDYELKQNYPNPFNPITNLEFSIPERTNVSIFVYDILGRLVTMIIDEELAPGHHKVEFDGATLTSGLYFLHMKTKDFVDSKKMILLK